MLKKIYKSKPVKFIRHLILIKFLVLLLILVVLMPYRLSLFLGRILGIAACRLLSGYRLTVERNLIESFPDFGFRKIREIRDGAFKNIAMNLVEFAMMSFRARKFWMKRIKIEGDKYIRENINEKKGIILLSAHIGNWELMGSYLAMRGFPINVVARRIYDKRLNWLLVAMRKNRNVNTIYRSPVSNTKKMIRVLKSGEILGILIDQDTDVSGTFVDFFGRPAYTPTAVSQFARVKNTVVLSSFIYRNKKFSHRILVKKVDYVDGDERTLTQFHTKIIEDFIRKHPAEWVWMHPRWKRQPGVLARPRSSSQSGAGFIHASRGGAGFIALLGFLLFFGCSPKSKQNPSNAEKEKVGHEISVENQAAKIINNFTLTETEGIRKIWVLDAESAIDTENLLKLKNLRIKFYEDNAVTFLKSPSGRYNKKTQVIKAEGKVVLKTKTKEIVTYDVVWDPVVKKFMSDSELTIKTESGTIRGKGMVASMDLSDIKIKQRIIGKLE